MTLIVDVYPQRHLNGGLLPVRLIGDDAYSWLGINHMHHVPRLNEYLGQLVQLTSRIYGHRWGECGQFPFLMPTFFQSIHQTVLLIMLNL